MIVAASSRLVTSCVQVDVQSSELLVLDPPILRQFMNAVDVVAIKMEWEGQRDPEKRTQIDRLLDTFYSYDMKIYDLFCWPDCRIELNRNDWLLWPDDVLIIDSRYAQK
jgi:hypothetical protein